MAKRNLLVGDIGGTNARFALADTRAPAYSDVIMLKCADFKSTEAAIKHYLGKVGAASPDVVCLAAAGPVVEDRIRVTNNHWILARDSLAEEFDTEAVRLLNDFEAIAYSVPFLTEQDCLPVGLPDPEPLPDDEYAIAHLLKNILVSWGYEVVVFTESPKALEHFKETPNVFKLVVTDQTMPKITGLELAREMLELRPDLPIILCTGYSEFPDVEGARNINVRGFLSKPLDFQKLSQMVKELVE